MRNLMDRIDLYRKQLDILIKGANFLAMTSKKYIPLKYVPSYTLATLGIGFLAAKKYNTSFNAFFLSLIFARTTHQSMSPQEQEVDYLSPFLNTIFRVTAMLGMFLRLQKDPNYSSTALYLETGSTLYALSSVVLESTENLGVSSQITPANAMMGN